MLAGLKLQETKFPEKFLMLQFFNSKSARSLELVLGSMTEA